MTGSTLLSQLHENGFDFFTGVPCSLLDGLYRALLDGDASVRAPLIEAVREDEAIGHAAGAYLAGRRPVVMMQNSGLGNSLNAIISLSQIYALPFLLLVTWRGFEGNDAPEHLVMGRAMPAILEAVELPFEVLDPVDADGQLARARENIVAGRPSALVVKKGVVT